MKVLVRTIFAIGEVVVHHDVDALDVNTAAEEVGGHQDPLFEVLELLVAVCASDTVGKGSFGWVTRNGKDGPCVR